MMVTVTDSGNGLMTGRAKEENNKGRARERVVGKERTIETQMRKFSERRKAHHSN